MLFLEIFGYAASVVIAVSLMMSSILKLRWINMFGALMFSTYGFLIGALPVGVLNGFICAIDIYYLVKMYSRKEYYKVLEVRPENRYMIEFFDFYKKDIHQFFPGFTYKQDMNTICFLILRDMAVAGAFLAHPVDEKTLKVGLDYVIPEYRDFKTGKYIYLLNYKYFTEKGYSQLCCKSKSKTHDKYLSKMGFVKENRNNEELFVKYLN